MRQLEKKLKKIIASGGEAKFLVLNVLDEQRWKEVVNDVIKTYGKLDILVNNAGIGHSCLAEDENLDKWRSLMAINFDAFFRNLRSNSRYER